MKLLTLSLENFQGLKKEQFNFDGKDGILFGNNATGKSTVNNAFTWLLFDKAANGAKNYTPKTKSKDGDMHYLNHAAEGVFELNDGQILTLKKIYHEVYKTKRGSATEEFSGHTTDYYIDGVPSSEKEYSKTILQICGEPEQTKVLTMPHYFPEDMAWADRRKILIDVCGDVSDDDVIKGSPELKDFEKYLLKPGTKDQRYTVDEYKKIALAKKSDISKQRQDIPGRIDEVQRAIPDTSGINVDAIKAEIKALEIKKQEHEVKKSDLISGNTVSAEIRKKIADVHVDIAEARAKHAEENTDINADIRKAVSQLEEQEWNLYKRIGDIKSEISSKSIDLERIKKLRQDIYDEYMEKQSVVWDDKKEMCPTCKRPLPMDAIEDMKNDFNVVKSNALEEINERGKRLASKEMIADIEKEIERLTTEKTNHQTDYKLISEQIKDLKAKVKKPVPFEDTEEYKSLKEKLSALKSKEHDADDVLKDQIAEQTEEIQRINGLIREQENAISKLDQAKELNKRISELEALDKELLQTFEKVEQGLYLCEVFTKTKVSMLDDKINSKFSQVRFRLFIEQQNGGIKEDCEVMIPSADGKMVPFTFANSAARMNAGLEIIDTLSKHWGLTLPVFIDNAEAVQKLIPMDTQIIQTVVPLAWDKLDQDTKDVYKIKYGAYAEGEYSKKYNKLVLETN